MTDQPAPADDEPGGRRVDLGKLNARLSTRIGALVQENEALQILVEDAEEALAAERRANAALRAQLVAATRGDVGDGGTPGPLG